MLSVIAPIEYHSRLNDIIAKESRLSELVDILDASEHDVTPSADVMYIEDESIAFPIDWFNVLPPFLLPEEVELSEHHLLSLIFFKLNNIKKSYEYLEEKDPSFLKELDFINRLQQGIPIDPNELTGHYSPFEEYRLMHNQAVVRYYGATPENFDLEKTNYFFQEAMKTSPSADYEAFTSRQFGLMAIDLQRPEGAVGVIEPLLSHNISEQARIELQAVLCQAWQQQLTVPYDENLLTKLKVTLWSVVENYEAAGRKAELGLVLLDACHVANISESFSESLGYVNRAITLFDDQDLRELSANAQLRKGTLLYTWAQNGNPQFFKPAIESYQEALKVFTKEVAPEVFADIHHHLGVIYTDMPSDSKRKSIWAGVANSSFMEALEYYTKETHPYEYGMICNNYGNAFSKFPQAVLTDNYEKAIFYYQEALDVRGPAYKMERAITLLNYLEASWSVGNDTDGFNEPRYLDMIAKAEEVKQLVDDEGMLDEANRHLELLTELKEVQV